MIYKSLTTPSMIVAGFHKVQKVGFSDLSTTVVVDVASWVSDAEAFSGQPPVRVWHITVPPSCLDGSVGLTHSIETWLVNQAEQPWFGGSVVRPAAATLAAAQAQKWALLKQTRDSLISSPLATAYGDVQAGPAEAANILRASLGALIAEQQGQAAQSTVILLDNTVVSLTAAQLAGVALAYRTREQVAREHCQVLRGWVYHETATVDTVAQIEWATSELPVAVQVAQVGVQGVAAELSPPPVLPIT